MKKAVIAAPLPTPVPRLHRFGVLHLQHAGSYTAHHTGPPYLLNGLVTEPGRDAPDVVRHGAAPQVAR